jgi:hypothetical protein
MPDLCSLKTQIECPACGAPWTPPDGVIRFQWGEVPRAYRAGDAVEWLKDGQGQPVPPFTLHKVGKALHWNYGDPAFDEVLAFDIDPHQPEFFCPHCQTRFEAIAAYVAQRRFVTGVAFLAGQVREKFGAALDDFEVATRMADTTWQARTDWSNPFLKS